MMMKIRKEEQNAWAQKDTAWAQHVFDHVSDIVRVGLNYIMMASREISDVIINQTYYF